LFIIRPLLMPEPSSRIEQASLFRPCIAGFSAQAGRLQQASGRAGVAQLVEQRTCNAKVEGSIPFSGTINSKRKGQPGRVGFFALFNQKAVPLMFNATRMLRAVLFVLCSLGLAGVVSANDHGGGGGGGSDLVTLETITTNLGREEDGGSKFIQLVIALRLSVPEGAAAINAYMPQVRNDILLLLSSHTGTSLMVTQARKDLAEEVKDAVNGIVGTPAKVDKKGHREPADGPVKSVLFTSFIIQ
jgi:flagellar basal body-associated protein FliL